MKRSQGKIDIALAVLSVILGMGVWLAALTEEGNKKNWTIRVKRIDVVNLPEHMKATKVPTEWTVTLRGPASEIDRLQELKSFSPTATIDLRGATPDRDEYPISIDWPSDMPNVDKDNYATRAKVTVLETSEIPRPVDIIETGEMPSGLQYVSAVVVPDKVTVEATREELLEVGQVRVVLDVSKVANGGIVRLPVNVLDRKGRNISDRVIAKPNEVSVSATFSADQPRRTVLVSPRLLGNAPPGFRVARVEVTPPTVTVAGDRTALSNLYLVETQPISLGSLPASGSITVGLRLPGGAQSVSAKRVTVKVTLEALPSSTAPPVTGGGSP